METIQIEGVSSTVRETKGELGNNTSLVITERVMTSGNQIAKSIFDIDLNGENLAYMLLLVLLQETTLFKNSAQMLTEITSALDMLSVMQLLWIRQKLLPLLK